MFKNTDDYLREILDHSYFGVGKTKEKANPEITQSIIKEVIKASRKLSAKLGNADEIAAK